ncbi:MAG: DUF1285 domain-containing protein [Sphingomonadales bacterium]|nr:DUF1285 domain-containing protein [Sphingomonadales bacterium]
MAEPIQPPAPDLASTSLAELMRYANNGSLPPVEKWHPQHCGDSEMRIAADGTWFHQGTPIGRAAMVKLFSTVLRREPDGSHVLVTPVERLALAVDDAPFTAVEVKAEGAGRNRRLAFRLNTGDIVVAGSDHPLRFEDRDDGPHPYLHVRGKIGNGLEALIVRPVYYELVGLALDDVDGDPPPAIWSDGAMFALAPA